jgi:outer membrane protein assembly factor BamD
VADGDSAVKVVLEMFVTSTGDAARGQRVVRWRNAAAALVFGFALAGCSTISGIWNDGSDSGGSTIQPAASDGTATNGETAEKLFLEGQVKMHEGKYRDGAKKFEEIERQFPYSSLARRGILMTAFAHYQRNQYDESILAAKRYITLYPGNKDAAYAYYLIGLSYYEQITDVGRDQRVTEQALEALTEVERRFPDSEYARDAKQKAQLARDHLAGKEMKVGRYYLTRQSYVAAINRFRKVVTDYQTTSHTPEALERLTEAYMALGIQGEAQTAAAILGHNYPDSQWYKDAYTLLKTDGLEPRENKESWMSRAWKSVSIF